MKKFVLIILYLSLNTIGNSRNFPYKFNRAHKAFNGHHLPCEYSVNVSDNRPTDCIFGGNFVMYPVLVEDFNFKEELPNNWRFTMSYNPNVDNYGGEGLHGITYLGNAYNNNNNNNVYPENGIGYLQWKKETVVANNQTYNYTGSFLSSLNKLRQGGFEARILLPNYPIHFPAFWLFDNQEIELLKTKLPK